MTKSDIFTKINALADKLVAKDGKMTHAQAVEKVCEQHPELYAEYRGAADSLAPAQPEQCTVLKLTQRTLQGEIERVAKKRGLSREAAAIAVAKENPDLIALSRDPASADRTVNEATVRKSASWLETHLDLTPGKALVRAIEYDSLPPSTPAVPVPHAPSVQKKDPTNEKIEKGIKICEDVRTYLEEEWDVAARRPVRKFNRAMTFAEVRALDKAA